MTAFSNMSLMIVKMFLNYHKAEDSFEVFKYLLTVEMQACVHDFFSGFHHSAYTSDSLTIFLEEVEQVI